MTELSFLIELLLNHDLPKETKALIASRIKEVEQNLTVKPVPPAFVPSPIGGGTYYSSGSPNNPNAVSQAPSTLALMAKHGDLPPQAVPPPPPPPADAAAMAQAAAKRTAQLAALAQQNIEAPKGTKGARKW